MVFCLYLTVVLNLKIIFAGLPQYIEFACLLFIVSLHDVIRRETHSINIL